MKLSKRAQNKIRIQKNKAEIAELDNQLAREAYFAVQKTMMHIEATIDRQDSGSAADYTVPTIYEMIQKWRVIDNAIWSNWNKARSDAKRRHRQEKADAK